MFEVTNVHIGKNRTLQKFTGLQSRLGRGSGLGLGLGLGFGLGLGLGLGLARWLGFNKQFTRP